MHYDSEDYSDQTITPYSVRYVLNSRIKHRNGLKCSVIDSDLVTSCDRCVGVRDANIIRHKRVYGGHANDMHGNQCAFVS